ncbi:integrase domain-containing protein [Endozoicomonas sp. SM1973]|uniref:Integrase domain-containing protein n=1 Tax=Spartinivicinus marinus TaxID=2994442 RepID=A0A853ID35_9GAMM|nr:phage integrase N-terminal domain-containing protein [Spartinivicinus marinus]MCX4030198.1 integrase domain-containing protein [Spartinivicinus marinus]NYZ67841.1 integrase domain-containing protein [Spartinivicinus marinus]
MKKLNFELKQLCDRNRDGSYSTQSKRHHTLQLVASQLHEMGFRKMNASSIKPKHVEALVNRWKEEDLQVSTIKDRMSSLRWWAQKVNKAAVIARSNDSYGIDKRVYVTNESKAQTLDSDKLNTIKDMGIKLSLELQRAFGLRREECLKFTPSFAIQADHIRLKDSWTKGGRPRNIPIRNDYQRDVLKRVQAYAGSSSMIPANKSYRQHLRSYERLTQNAGFSKMHGLRHHYAQERYIELTGMVPPAAGGKSSKELTPEEKMRDQLARQVITHELGHSREQITAVYLGR